MYTPLDTDQAAGIPPQTNRPPSFEPGALGNGRARTKRARSPRTSSDIPTSQPTSPQDTHASHPDHIPPPAAEIARELSRERRVVRDDGNAWSGREGGSGAPLLRQRASRRRRAVHSRWAQRGELLYLAAPPVSAVTCPSMPVWRCEQHLRPDTSGPRTDGGHRDVSCDQLARRAEMVLPERRSRRKFLFDKVR